ncbi:hypothetical protein K505DRAFT_359825 [Melanomma pulvis-pyrius CBS 109.77]|uniref:MYND-type domain-containing protein n=1 Tax=Melanomma pulvis-pyrius CBS 109.77 TaxID=1314802 RepID=A0A6A6XHJ3_9PLEO|nr:hypothetical protein K505DRAFT_359825 [Melanomma pulvis-pyrius CBS 109.77]
MTVYLPGNAPTDPPGKCDCCRKAGTDRCATCGTSSYCSTTCFERDHHNHIDLCRDFDIYEKGDVYRPERKGLKVVRGILLAENSPKPCFIYVIFKHTLAGELPIKFGGIDDKLSQCIGEGNSQFARIDCNRSLGRALNYTIHIQYNGIDPEQDKAAPCRSLRKFVGKTKAAQRFKGTFIAWRIEGNLEQNKDKHPVVCDLDTTAMPAIIDFFKWKMDYPDKDHADYRFVNDDK